MRGQAFAQRQGGTQQALQAFLLPGPGTDAQKVLFIMAFATVLFGCINGAREIVKEAAIYKRERAVNLAILPYMFSKIVVLGMLCLLQSAILTLVIELGEPLRQGILLISHSRDLYHPLADGINGSDDWPGYLSHRTQQ